MLTMKYGLTNIQPFVISLAGIVADLITTRIGLGMGFYETHLQYQPIYALMIFWGTLTILTLALPKGKFCATAKNVLASAAFLGSVNNTLVIFGIFSGLRI